MVRAVPEQPQLDAAEDLWLGCHDLWLQPIEWWTAWWNAWVLPVDPHRFPHSRRNAAGHWLVVPEPIAHESEQDLFA
jgi:hypothetical protein